MARSRSTLLSSSLVLAAASYLFTCCVFSNRDATFVPPPAVGMSTTRVRSTVARRFFGDGPSRDTSKDESVPAFLRQELFPSTPEQEQIGEDGKPKFWKSEFDDLSDWEKITDPTTLTALAGIIVPAAIGAYVVYTSMPARDPLALE